MSDYYNNFKPIKNRIRDINLWYIIDELNKYRKAYKGIILPEVIEFIYLNSIVYSYESNSTYITEKQKRNWSKVIKESTDLQTRINSFWFKKKGPWTTLQKLSLNQLKSGRDNYLSQIFRYYYIFSKSILVDHIESKIGMSYKDFIICAMWLHSVFHSKSYCVDKSYFLRPNDKILSIENMTKVLSILSITYDRLKSNLKTELRYDLDTFITHDFIHIKKPIFEFNNKLYCLYHEHLLNQLTSGIYYIAEIYKEKHNLSNVYGSAFEDYVGLILERNNETLKFSINKEIIYSLSEGEKKTSDWILMSSDSIAFIECKTKRLVIKSKKFEDIVESDKIEIAKAIVQVYKVYFDYKNNLIPDLEYDSSKKFIPIIITLEEWFAGAIDFKEEIESIVKKILLEEVKDVSIVDSSNFHVLSISNFEIDIQLMAQYGLKYYFDNIFRIDKNAHKYKKYFKKDIERLLIEPLQQEYLE